MAHIQSLLKISLDFKTSNIVHSFSAVRDAQLTIQYLEEDHLFKMTATNKPEVEYYTSIDQAAKALYTEIHFKDTR